MFSASVVIAQQKPASGQSQYGELATSSLDALEKASQYSFDTGGIGILIGFGTDNGVSAPVIGDQFVQELNRRGVLARYYYYEADWRGMVIEYHIQRSALGPWGVEEAAMKIGQAVERAKAADRVENH